MTAAAGGWRQMLYASYARLRCSARGSAHLPLDARSQRSGSH